jgi:hydroxylysine kinase
MLQRGLERFNDLVTPRLPGLRTQVLHNDFSRSNLLVDHGDPAFLTGVIDFGDAVRTAVAIDVSTALLNQLPRDGAYSADDNILADPGDVLRGYLRQAELDEQELALLPHLVMGRVIGRALITTYRARQIPANTEYIMRNADPGWHQLAWFLDQDPHAVSRRLS